MPEVLTEAEYRRSPCGERGLKYPERFAAAGGRRRSPCGERGLKWGRAAAADAQGWSLPVRGAWIEMRRKKLLLLRYRGRSPCGERGLKCFRKAQPLVHARRSPCGERGLKSRGERFSAIDE